MRMQIRKVILRMMVIAIMSTILMSSTIPTPIIAHQVESVEFIPCQESTDALLILDNNYGANYHYIRTILEGWGWSLTTAALSENVTPCGYQSPTSIETVDVLITEIVNVTDYDIISIMPGNTHHGLVGSNDTLNLIRDAVEANMVVSAWCKAVLVLAIADVIDGKNVTGNADYADDYEAAGATYLGVVPPVIDGNIVTGVRSRYYRTEMCIAMASAIGVYEEDAPNLLSCVFTPSHIDPVNTSMLEVIVSDATRVSLVEAKLFGLVIETGEKNETGLLAQVDFTTQCACGINTLTTQFSGLTAGLYTVDIVAEDIYGNEMTYEFAANLTVGSNEIPTQIDLGLIGIGTGAGVIVLLGIIVLIRKKP